MNLIEELKGLGVEVQEGLDRVMGDSDLYEMMLGMFIDSVADNPISLADFEGDDLAELTERVHMFKGITGNLAITPLFIIYTEMLGLLRSGKAAEAKSCYQKLLPDQERVIACIKKHKTA